MKLLLALDSFKGSLPAREAVDAAAAGLAGGEAVRLPLSDGGEGFTECVVETLGGTYRSILSHDALGRPLLTRYGLVHHGEIAVIETAAASGLTHLSSSEPDPVRASSYGTGELIEDAIRQGVNEIWIGLGGTAVMDAGAGMLRALGPLPAPVSFRAFYDVNVPLTGPSGAAVVFGPQKGADEKTILLLEERFQRQARKWEEELGKKVDGIPGAGAAGGIGAALAVCLGAEMHAGIGAVLDAVGFRNLLNGCDLVITGEGRADRQTLKGKVPYGVLQATRRYAPDVPVVLLAGQVQDRELLTEAGFDAVVQVTPERELVDGKGLEPSVARAHIGRTVRQLVQDFPYLRNQ